MTETSTRRAVVRRGLVASGVVGTAWVAPRVSGLSLRPDYAAAQSVGPTTTSLPADGTGFSFDFTSTVSAQPSDLVARNIASPVPGIDLMGFSWGSIGHGGGIAGPAAAISCVTTGIDVVGGDLVSSIVDGGLFSSPGSIHALVRNHVTNGPGLVAVTVHARCD